jgi:DNA topoisomerase IB
VETSVHSPHEAAAAPKKRRKRLRRSDPGRPGVLRIRGTGGAGFDYVMPNGEPVHDAETLARIEVLAIPPAWRDVWICPWDNGHLQAVGTDAAGRRQYLYHERWRRRRDEEKFERMLEFARTLPRVRQELIPPLRQPGLGRERVLACAVRLLDRGFFRIGGESYAGENGSYGLATLRKEHVGLGADGLIVFTYVGKAGKMQERALVDREAYEVVRLLKQRHAGGDELLAYHAGPNVWRDVRSDDINAYIKQLAGERFSAKDFRTWHATVLAAIALAISVRVARSRSGSRRAITRAIRETAIYLGNTPAVARASYIDPRVFDRYRDGHTILSALDGVGGALDLDTPQERETVEAAVIDLLEDRPMPLVPELRKTLATDGKGSVSAVKRRAGK